MSELHRNEMIDEINIFSYIFTCTWSEIIRSTTIAQTGNVVYVYFISEEEIFSMTPVLLVKRPLSSFVLHLKRLK